MKENREKIRNLRAERSEVIKAILELGHVPVGMEMFSAADEEQWKMIARQIDQSDYYVVILAHRYGTRVFDGGTSYTEKEYDYAVSQNIPVLGFVIDVNVARPPTRSSEADQKSMDLFQSKVRRKPTSTWSSAADLYGKVSIALSKAITYQPRPGWIRTPAAPGEAVVAEIARLSADNDRLRSELMAVSSNQKGGRDGDRIEEVLDLMRYRDIRISIFYRDAEDWDYAGRENLLKIFEWIASDLAVESSSESIASSIAFTARRDNSRLLRETWPFPKNVLIDVLADLQALNLVRHSDRLVAVGDAERYWTFTEFGARLHSDLRQRHMKRSRSKAKE